LTIKFPLHIVARQKSNALSINDTDPDGSLRAQANALSARALPDTVDFARDYPYRDSVVPLKIKIWEGPSALYPFIERINRALRLSRAALSVSL